jgi:hypothetical protein
VEYVMTTKNDQAVNDQYGLRQLGYVGELTVGGDVMADHVEIPLDRQVEVTRAMVDLLAYVKVGQHSPVAYFLQTTAGGQSTAKFRENKETLDALILSQEILPGGSMIPSRGSATRGALRYEWGPVPPLELLGRVPDNWTVKSYPDFYIVGPGRALAELVPCAHLYNLTDSCPGCDHDEEEDATKVGPTGRERDGEHWNARLIRCQRALGMSEGYKLTAVEERLRDALELAHSTAAAELADVQRAFMADVRDKGPVRATRLHAKNAMKWDTTVAVWEHAVQDGKAGGGWQGALTAAESMAIRLLRESTAPTRNAVDGALAAVQGRTAESLLDTIANFRRTIR